MPSPTTAADLFRDALGLSNAVGVDQTLTADETQRCLNTLNDIYEDLSNQNLAMWGTSNQSFSTVAGQATYSIGPAGTWNTDRPINIGEPAICTYSGVDFPVWAWDQESYNLVSLKTQQQPIVQRFLFVNDFPLSYITLWPVPSQIVTMGFSIDYQLTNIATAGQALSFPKGYAKLYKYMLGVELAPLFGKQAPQDVKAIAVSTLANLKRVNKRTPVSRFDGVLVSGAPVSWQRGY